MDLEHYQQNPDELPSDLAEIEALIAGQQEEPQEKAPEEAAEPQAEEGENEATSSQAQKEEEPAPISSKDGKHTIPYAVLQSEREKRKAAEQVQQELMSRMSELEQRLQSGTSQQTQSQAVSDMLSGESIEKLVEDFPSLAPMIEYTRQLEGQVKQFSERFQQIEQIEVARQQEQLQRAQQDVRTEVDANPALRFWEAKDPEKWQAAMEADRQIRTMPVNKNLSLKDRFTKVVAVVEAIYGPTELPQEFAPKEQPPKEDLSAKVKKAVESAESETPKTLGEMPGGMPPKTDPMEDLLTASPAKMAAMLDRLTPDQINELLAKAG